MWHWNTAERNCGKLPLNKWSIDKKPAGASYYEQGGYSARIKGRGQVGSVRAR